MRINLICRESTGHAGHRPWARLWGFFAFFFFFLLINSNFIFIMFSKIFIYLTALSLSCNP